MPEQIFKLALTPGEPSGIGPDLCIQIAQQGHQQQLIAIADPHMLAERAAQLALPLEIRQYDARQPAQSTPPGCLWVETVPCKAPVVAGQLNAANAQYVLDTLTRATTGCMNGEFSAIVTAPVHKGIINDAGIPFSGHTEFLEALTGSDKVVMMLATEDYGLPWPLPTCHYWKYRARLLNRYFIRLSGFCIRIYSNALAYNSHVFWLPA